MAIRIGHASMDENGAIVGGTPGDQTGIEVCIRAWYNGGWTFLARAGDSAAAEGIAAACEAGCANPNIGYDQAKRNTLAEQAKAADYDLAMIDTPCAADCSSFVAVCVMAAGIDIPFTSGNAPTTATLRSVLENTGAFSIYSDSRYLTGTGSLRRGDILVKPGSHTVIVLDNGAGEGASLPMLKKGSSGGTVKALQFLLIGYGFDCGTWGPDGEFGTATEKAVRAFQTAKGLEADGIVGEKTWAKLLGI